MTDNGTAVELVRDALKNGLLLKLDGDGALRASGPRHLIDRYGSRIKASKAALLAYLRQCSQPQSGPCSVGNYTATVVTDTALGDAVLDPAGVEPPEPQHHEIKLHPTHHTTAPLLFHQPGRGPFVIEAGTKVHVFPSLFAAEAAGLPPETWEGLGHWAAQKNVEKGYRLAWIDNDLRGVYPDHLEELDE